MHRRPAEQGAVVAFVVPLLLQGVDGAGPSLVDHRPQEHTGYLLLPVGEGGKERPERTAAHFLARGDCRAQLGFQRCPTLELSVVKPQRRLDEEDTAIAEGGGRLGGWPRLRRGGLQPRQNGRQHH